MFQLAPKNGPITPSTSSPSESPHGVAASIHDKFKNNAIVKAATEPDALHPRTSAQVRSTGDADR